MTDTPKVEEVAAVDAELGAAKAELAKVQDALNVEMAKNQSSNQMIGEVINANLNLRAATILHQKQNNEQSQQIVQLNVQNGTLTSDLAKAQEQVADLTKQVAMLTAQNADLNAKVASLEGELETATAPAEDSEAAA
jgi:chromosome segregation ATPase